MPRLRLRGCRLRYPAHLHVERGLPTSVRPPELVRRLGSEWHLHRPHRGHRAFRQTQNQRAEYLGGDPYAANKGPGLWLNPAAFGLPASGRYGNSARNGFRGPGLWQTDLGLTKTFRVNERANIDFRTELFNLFNRAQYGNPVNARNNSTFGTILTTANDGATGTGTSRQVQFMLRLNF